MLPRSAGHRLGARQAAYPFLFAENPSRIGFADQDLLNAPASQELLYGEAAKGKTYQAVRHIHQDSEAYKKATGMGKERLLRNLAAVRSAYPHLPIHLRTTLIPGINNDEELIRRIVELACSMDAVHYELLPYHRMDEQKYRFGGREYPYGGPAQVDSGILVRLRRIVEEVVPEKD